MFSLVQQNFEALPFILVTIIALHTELDLYYVQSTDVQKQHMSDFQLLITNLLNYMPSRPPI